jgi:5'-nucleotidase
MKKPLILITNDDGIHTPGIKHLAAAVKEFADVTVVAPQFDQSGVGVSITTRTPLHITPYPFYDGIPAYSVSGTPADCVKLALRVVLKKTPDLILSGINRGTNAGRNVFYSGTIGGVIEGIINEIPGIALSCHDLHYDNFALLETPITSVVTYVLNKPLPRGTLLNVNFPPSELGKIKGFKLTRQGKQYWAEDPKMREHPVENKNYYWMGARIAEFEEEEESDISWLKKGYMTAVPVHVGELTDHNHLKLSKTDFEALYSTF